MREKGDYDPLIELVDEIEATQTVLGSVMWRAQVAGIPDDIEPFVYEAGKQMRAALEVADRAQRNVTSETTP